MFNNDIIKKALEVWPHRSLYDLANDAPERTPNQPAVKKDDDKDLFDSNITNQIPLSEDEKRLACHIVTSLFVPYKQRGIQLKFSMRKLGDARNGLISKEMVKEMIIGQCLFLMPTEKLYINMGMVSPYKRGVSLDHSFAVLFAQHCIEADPMVQKTAIEVPTDDRGSAIDCVSYLRNGDRVAWEITLSCTTNVTSHAAKLKNKGFSRIIFVCRDHHIRKSAQTILGDAGFEPEFFSTIECMLFSDLIRGRKGFETENCK